MAIAVRCACGKRFAAREEQAGKKFRCPQCRASVDVPFPEKEPSDEPRPVSTSPRKSQASVSTVALDELQDFVAADSAPTIVGSRPDKPKQNRWTIHWVRMPWWALAYFLTTASVVGLALVLSVVVSVATHDDLHSNVGILIHFAVRVAYGWSAMYWAFVLPVVVADLLSRKRKIELFKRLMLISTLLWITLTIWQFCYFTVFEWPTIFAFDTALYAVVMVTLVVTRFALKSD
jgi:hypothetical protein